ncbi:ATP-grasp domain-containing protein [Streptosporangium roseum]|uniref:ATP-grasp domain-containing protein n=1 Tax=Streptosporangium roseum (strain ATCC 12428 / DSM 43021 / JCM 3005 / KCTC 9067 / NCIMB 10171 / NRRL 2505 / NI 9100) TaxID=479432 RepID=D2AS62_STRRD|nr:ATP-grasp domain-containing protein [Streptosporangium roseum]ACZ86589.1 conserved hypothetical protein [Streptosporangium roseum DSM 43021]
MTLPVVLVVGGAGSASPMEVADAAAGLCRPLFAYRRSDPSVSTRLIELFELLGPAVDLDDAGDLRRLGARGIVSFSDAGIGQAAAIAEELCLEYHSSAAATALTDKSVQRAVLAAAGAESVRHARVSSSADVGPALRSVGVPAVVKPVSGSGSRDTYPVSDVPAGSALLRELLADRPGTAYIVEEQLSGDTSVAGPAWGDYVSVETLVTGGHPRPLAVTGRLPLEAPYRETGFFVPATLRPETVSAAAELAHRAIRALGVTSGLVHTELKLTATGPRVIEVNGRLGGFVAPLLRRAAGVDPVRLALAAALGTATPRTLSYSCVAFQRLVLPRAGAVRVAGIRGVEDLGRVPGVEQVRISALPGAEVDWRAGYHGNLGLVAGAVEDHGQLSATLDEITRVLRVEYVYRAEVG